MQYSINLIAGVPQRQLMTGKTLVLLSTGAASTVDLTLEINGFSAEEFRGVRRGLKLLTPGFGSAKFTADVNCTIEVIASEANISIDYQDGATVNATIVGTPAVTISGQPVAVVNDRGAPGNPVNVVGISYTDAPAVTLQDNAAIAVGAVAVALFAAKGARREVRITNLGADPVALGAAGITWAKRCIVVNSGDTWIETRGANLTWSAICDADKTASLTVQEVIA